MSLLVSWPGLNSETLWARRKLDSKLKQGQTMNMNLAFVVYPEVKKITHSATQD